MVTGAVTSHVRPQVGYALAIASITNEAELGRMVGDEVSGPPT